VRQVVPAGEAGAKQERVSLMRQVWEKNFVASDLMFDLYIRLVKELSPMCVDVTAGDGEQFRQNYLLAETVNSVVI